MAKKNPFPFKPGDRVNVPGKKSVQGFVSYPMGRADGECGDIRALDKSNADNEGRVIFVTWIDEAGARDRAYFTEANLMKANAATFDVSDRHDVNELVGVLQSARRMQGKR